MNNAEQAGFRLAAWIHAHRTTARIISLGIVLALVGIAVYYHSSLSETRQGSVAFIPVGMAIMAAVHLVQQKRTRTASQDLDSRE